MRLRNAAIVQDLAANALRGGPIYIVDDDPGTGVRDGACVRSTKSATCACYNDRFAFQFSCFSHDLL
jgi:hypothetical protein